MATANLKPMRNRANLSGMLIGSLEVIEDVGSDEMGHRIWRCLCHACGGEYRTRAGYLRKVQRRGASASCGCQKRLSLSTHGLSKHPLYETWCRIIKRCTDSSYEHFHHYGGRGIQVCQRWRKFEGFWADMAPTWSAGLSIDRIDVDGNYEPSNCRWATQKTQSNNKRNNRILATPSGDMTLMQAAEHYGIDRNTISHRIDAMGWSVERAVTQPKRSLRPRSD